MLNVRVRPEPVEGPNSREALKYMRRVININGISPCWFKKLRMVSMVYNHDKLRSMISKCI